jgi:hypothetical protein
LRRLSISPPQSSHCDECLQAPVRNEALRAAARITFIPLQNAGYLCVSAETCSEGADCRLAVRTKMPTATRPAGQKLRHSAPE